ncbi:sugar ABC transporter substrate-binding protein [Vibrio sp. TH_r3]|uniref:ABC transporter substrate-binding protein n=1 Tax=unclassified Vibrio TaxID=2614977 RepID=UPI0029534F0C|nr:sugar ABC transporter substrate-binding protein [Vibrio sp. TH_r3]MDV7105587.1 sugar ABC transporter substrate-binding protein [Vibrio sp. TH_r3]
MRLIKLATLITALCTSSITTAETLRFTVWTGGKAHLDMLNKFSEGFKETHPDVNVKFETIPFADYVQKVSIQISGNNPPDLGWMLESSAPTFIDAKVLSDVSATLKETANYDYGDFSQSAMELWVRDKEVYGIPFSTSPLVVFYNQDMLEQNGLTNPNELVQKGEWTWDRFKTMAAKMTNKSAGVYGFETMDGNGYDSRVWETILPIIRSYGSDAWIDNKCDLDSKESIEAVSLYHEMVYTDQSAVPPGESADFFNAKAGLTITQISRTTKLDDASFKWGIAPMPSGPDGASPIIGQAAVVVFKDSPNKKLAQEFLAYMTNKVGIETMAEFFPPARNSVLNSQAFLTSNPRLNADAMKIVADGINTGNVLPAHSKMAAIKSSTKGIFDELWKDDANIEKTMNKICSRIDKHL